MPVYNLAPRISSLIDVALRRLNELSSNFELIIVDDGSTDGTLEKALTIQDRRLRVVGYSENRGKGVALMYGLRFTTCETVILTDGDLQALPVDLTPFLRAIKQCDIVIASKRVYGAKVEASFRRKFLSIGFNTFVKVLLSIPVSDTQAGFKIFSRKAVKSIVPLISVKHYAFDVELLTVANLLNLKVAELPAEVRLESNFRNKNIVRMFVDLLGIAYRLRIKHWYQQNLEKCDKKYKPILIW